MAEGLLRLRRTLVFQNEQSCTLLTRGRQGPLDT
jgi:hypothetical protein